MAEEVISKIVLRKIKEYLKWYTYPALYFLVTSGVCFIAWYTKPVGYRESIKVIFKTVSAVPAVIWIGVVTAWILVVILFSVFFYRLTKIFPLAANLRISA